MSVHFANFIEINKFLTSSEYSNVYLLYLISIDLHAKCSEILTKTNSKYCELGNLEVTIHNSSIYSLSYVATKGQGIKLPCIKNYQHN